MLALRYNQRGTEYLIFLDGLLANRRLTSFDKFARRLSNVSSD